jgi:anion-transporting  ArsA/GET3 family ATPase
MARLLDKRLLVITGKGGTGKSTVSAALALISARERRRTLVCEVNAKDRVTQLLGAPPAGPEITSLAENLWAVNIRPEEAMREYALMTLRLESIYKAVFENRFVRYFLRFVPSLQELVMLGKVLYHLQQKLPDGSDRFQTIVLDAPATGHAISFLSVPRVLAQTVPPGAMLREAQRMQALLEDAAITAAILVSLPEEMPVNETVELGAGLRQREIHPQAVVLNAFTAPRFSESDLAALDGKRRLLILAREHRRLSELSRQSRETLERGLNLPLITLARRYERRFAREAVEQIASELEPGLKAEQ